MDSQHLHNEYLQEGTAGYVMIRKFHLRYSDVLARIHLIHINDVVHEIFLSLSKANISEVRNIEHYIKRAIKLQCWSLLDKAIRHKTLFAQNDGIFDSDDDAKNHERAPTLSQTHDHMENIEGAELLVQINLFKELLNPKEVRLLNYLIDEAERVDIAKFLNVNINTLDTNLRRLRIKLAGYLQNLGYNYKGLEKFHY